MPLAFTGRSGAMYATVVSRRTASNSEAFKESSAEGKPARNTFLARSLNGFSTAAERTPGSVPGLYTTMKFAEPDRGGNAEGRVGGGAGDDNGDGERVSVPGAMASALEGCSVPMSGIKRTRGVRRRLRRRI